MLLMPTPVWQTAHRNSPEICRKSRPVPQIMILVFPTFTFSPFSSIAEPPDTFLERFSDDNKVIGIEVLPGDPRAEQWWRTSPAPVTQSTLPHQVFSAPTRLPSEALDQAPSPGLQKPCRVSCWQLDTSLAAAWQQRLCLLCLCLGRSQTGIHRLTPTVWWGRPQSSPGLSWPALLAWDNGSISFQCIPLTLVEADNEILLPVRGYLAIVNDCSCKITDHGDSWFLRAFSKPVLPVKLCFITLIYAQTTMK